MKRVFRIAFPIVSIVTLLIGFTNCSSGFNAFSPTPQSALRDLASAPAVLDDGTSPPPNLFGESGPNSKMVSVAVGVGGRILVGINGFQTVISEMENFSPALQAQIMPDPNDSTKLICPAPTIFLNGACCFGADHECIGGGWHSDFLYRGIAYGNGRFVAAGGGSWGISRFSTDGVNWSQKFNLTPESGLVTGAETGAWWIGDISFGNGHFVAADSDGALFTSTDGQHWETHSSKVTTGYLRHIEYMGDRFFVSGDNNTWAYSVDGVDWEATGTGGVIPTQTIASGNSYYGIANEKLYRLAKTDVKTNNWVEVYSHAGIDTVGYNTITKKFFLLAHGTLLLSSSLMGPWVESGTYAWWTTGANVRFADQNYVGTGAYSPDTKIWTSPTSMYTSPLIDVATGYVVVP